MLSYEISFNFLFAFRGINAVLFTRLQALKSPCKIFSKYAEGLHAFFVLMYIFRFRAVYLIPII